MRCRILFWPQDRYSFIKVLNRNNQNRFVECLQLLQSYWWSNDWNETNVGAQTSVRIELHWMKKKNMYFFQSSNCTGVTLHVVKSISNLEHTSRYLHTSQLNYTIFDFLRHHVSFKELFRVSRSWFQWKNLMCGE